MVTWNNFFFQNPSTALLETIILFNDLLAMILVSLFFFVLSLLLSTLWVKFFSLSFFENHRLETAWTMAPFILLLFIVVPSLSSLFCLDTCIFCGFPIGVSAHQWYWSYSLFEEDQPFFSYMLSENPVIGSSLSASSPIEESPPTSSIRSLHYIFKTLDMKISEFFSPVLGVGVTSPPYVQPLTPECLPSEVKGTFRLLDVDNRLVVPSCVPLRFMITSMDVLHSWTIPSFGVKCDAIPGRINQLCLLLKRSGIFFGQCSEICGANHSFMPIVLESVPFNGSVLS